MFGRRVRLTALTSISSAAVYSSSNRENSADKRNLHHEPYSDSTKSRYVHTISLNGHGEKPGLISEKGILNSMQQVDNSSVKINRSENLPSEGLPLDGTTPSTETLEVGLEPPYYIVPDFHGPSGPEYFNMFDDFMDTEDSNLNHEWSETPENIEEKENPDFKIMNSEVIRPNEQGRQQSQQEKLKAAISKARDLCWCKMYESGSPGMVVSIAVNGKVVWQHGFGYADLENRLLVGTGCIMRIASISKSLTMAVLAKLVEEGKVDLDESVSKYVPSWPDKIVDGENVAITVRQLCSHMGGVRHYEKKGEKTEVDSEFNLKEYHLKHTFKSTEESLALFKDDELHSKPGEEFLYSTHGFTLLAAVIESVTEEPFQKFMKKQFSELGLNNTYLDEHGPIIYNRSKYYVRDKNHVLKNAPYVDNSYKWAGGGFLSNVQDLTRFGNAMLYSYQKKDKLRDKCIQDQAKASKPVPADKELKEEIVEKENDKETEPNRPEESETIPVKEQDSETSKFNPKQVLKAKLESTSNSPSDVDSHPELECDGISVENISEVKGRADLHLNPVVYQAGPFSSVNKTVSKDKYLPGYLKSETVAEMWRPVPGTKLGWGGNRLYYGLGWAVRPKERNFAFGKNLNFYVSHTGGAIGASSVLLIAPSIVTNEETVLPQGVVVSILCNLESVGLNKLAVDIAKAFEGISTEKPVKVQKVYQC